MELPELYKIEQAESGNYTVFLPDKTGQIVIDVDIEAFKQACFWFYERHKIWFNKEYIKVPRPWTKDEILDKWKFTNVYRELDRGTTYILPYIQSTDNMPEDVLWNILRYRLFNNRHSHKGTGGFTSYDDFDYDTWYKAVRDRWAGGEQVLCQSHNTCTYSSFPGSDKVERVCLVAKRAHSLVPNLMTAIRVVLETEDPKTSKIEHVFDLIMKVPGFGPFLSYEVVMDLSYLYSELDTNAWANVGPGASRGLAFIFKGHKTKHELDLLRVLRDNLDLGWSLQGINPGDARSLLKYGAGKIDLRFPENGMCEFSKYMKLKTGTGRSFGGTYRPSKD